MEPLKYVGSQPNLGSPMRLQVWWRRGPLGPAWAALCGGVASGALTWSVEPLLHLALLLFLVELVWGGLWAALAATDWATLLHQWRHWQRGSPVRLLPYTSPDAPAGRLAQNWGHLRSWWAEALRPALGPTLLGVVLLLPLALVMAGVLGARPLMVTVGAISLLQFVFVWSGGDARPVPTAQALFEIALPWLAGQVLFKPISLASLLLALTYALSYVGGLRQIYSRSGLMQWNAGQVAALVVLVAARRPLAAGIVGLLFLGQAMAQPGLFDAESEEAASAAVGRFLRLAQPWLMAAMLVAAWGVGSG
jgi:hypothetical protein